MPIVITNPRTGAVTIVATAEEFEELDRDLFGYESIHTCAAADMLDDTSAFNTSNNMKLEISLDDDFWDKVEAIETKENNK